MAQQKKPDPKPEPRYVPRPEPRHVPEPPIIHEPTPPVPAPEPEPKPVKGAPVTVVPPLPVPAPQPPLEPVVRPPAPVEPTKPLGKGLSPEDELAELRRRVEADTARIWQLEHPIIEFPKMVHGRTFKDRAEQDAAGPEFADKKPDEK